HSAPVHPPLHSFPTRRSSDLIDMLCFDCGKLTRDASIASLPDHPFCQDCSSKLLAPLFWSSAYATNILHKKRDKQSLDENEQKADRKSTRLNSSHLVISYAVF